MEDRTLACDPRTSLSPAMDPSIVAWSPPGTQELPDVWGWVNQAGVSRQQVPDAGDVVCCCSAHKLGPGAHQLIFHVSEKRLLSELQPDPAQCSTKVICIYVVAGIGLGHQRRCIKNLHSTVHHAQCCTYI